jgi:hypothetical protein
MTTDVSTVLQQAESQKIWGSVEVTFQNGVVTLIRKVETYKPQETNNVQPHTNKK